jgi:hypothetical protein
VRDSGGIVDTVIVPKKHEVPVGTCEVFSAKRISIRPNGRTWGGDEPTLTYHALLYRIEACFPSGEGLGEGQYIAAG